MLLISLVAQSTWCFHSNFECYWNLRSNTDKYFLSCYFGTSEYRNSIHIEVRKILSPNNVSFQILSATFIEAFVSDEWWMPNWKEIKSIVSRVVSFIFPTDRSQEFYNDALRRGLDSPPRRFISKGFGFGYSVQLRGTRPNHVVEFWSMFYRRASN